MTTTTTSAAARETSIHLPATWQAAKSSGRNINIHQPGLPVTNQQQVGEVTDSMAAGDGGSAGSTKRLTIAFIGAKSVGKTSIIRQFVSNQFSDGVGSTVHPHRYATSLVANNRIIEIHISDFPAIDHFPEDSLQEWNLHCALQPGKIPPSFCRLRQASAYVLVFDSSRPAPTFQYIRQIREQILSHGGKDVYKKPMVVAANKQDLVVRQSMTSSSTSSRTGYSTGHRRIIHQSHQNGTLSGGGGGGGGGINGAGKNGTSSSSEWSCTVRKQWRCLYVECSAKFNWQMVHLFQQVVNAIESCSSGDNHRHSGGDPSRHHQLPHSIAQLVHLGQLAHLGSFNVPGGPPLPPPPPSRPPPSSERRLHRTSSRSRLQCPVC